MSNSNDFEVKLIDITSLTLHETYYYRLTEPKYKISQPLEYTYTTSTCTNIEFLRYKRNPLDQLDSINFSIR